MTHACRRSVAMEAFQRATNVLCSTLTSTSPPALSSFYLPPHLSYHSHRSTAPPTSLSRPSHPSFDDDIGGLGAINSFTKKLYHMVTTEDPDIISFTPDGLAFHVKDPKRLEAEVLPRYFRHSRFASLVRQLNFYNFRKASKERVLWVYKHKLFRRERPDLLECLRRKPSANLSKNRLNRCLTSSTSEPFKTVQDAELSPPSSHKVDRRHPPSYLFLEELKHHHVAPFSPTCPSGRTSTMSTSTSTSSSGLSPSSGRTSEATTPEEHEHEHGQPLSPSGLLFTRKRQRSDSSSSPEREEAQTLEAFLELSRFRGPGGRTVGGTSPTESAATSRDDDGEEDDELSKEDMDGYYLHALRHPIHPDVAITSSDNDTDVDQSKAMAAFTTMLNTASEASAAAALRPRTYHAMPAVARLSSLSDMSPTATDQDEWSTIQSLSLAAWGSTDGLVSSLSEHLPSYTHCQLTVFCLGTAPFSDGPSLCDAIHVLLTTCKDVADCLADTADALGTDRPALYSLLEGGQDGCNDQLVRVFLPLAVNHLRESRDSLVGQEAEVVSRCHALWTRHAARFY